MPIHFLKRSQISLFKNNSFWDAWLARSVQHATLDRGGFEFKPHAGCTAYFKQTLSDLFSSQQIGLEKWLCSIAVHSVDRQKQTWAVRLTSSNWFFQYRNFFCSNYQLYLRISNRLGKPPNPKGRRRHTVTKHGPWVNWVFARSVPQGPHTENGDENSAYLGGKVPDIFTNTLICEDYTTLSQGLKMKGTN